MLEYQMIYTSLRTAVVFLKVVPLRLLLPRFSLRCMGQFQSAWVSAADVACQGAGK